MDKKIILKRVFHRGKWRLLISFGFDADLSVLVRQVEGSRYSNTHKSWYAEDNEDTVKRILTVFRGHAEIDISAIAHIARQEKVPPPDDDSDFEDPTKNENQNPAKDMQKSSAEEIIPPIKSFGYPIELKRYCPVEFRINEEDGRLGIKFTGFYNKRWFEEIRSFGRYYYDKTMKEFLLPWSVLTVDSLSDYFSSQGAEVIIIKTAPTDVLKSIRKDSGDKIRSRQLSDKAVDGIDQMRRYLDEVRYSERTNESYLALLEFFFKYFNEKDPLAISPDEVSAFIHDFIVKNGYSKSYQNQAISAIKTFYRISGRGRPDLQLFERPRRSRALPKVFSKEEVQRILNATRNTKHKLLLWMIYSCGLRRSEITNVKLTDLDRDRGVLHIREGKGRVDRIVPVSKKVWEKLDEYTEGFHPSKYLFEGQGGGRYSSESVYRVFKQALLASGIKKEVGVHSLRHSYATHLHESGLDIRYIQELLGHRSTRTTEIYTHVSRRNLVVIRSPIEDMDVK
jgi:integrase/recombinase XerD